MTARRPRLLAAERLPPAPVQQRSRAKRERLKGAALALFGAKGYENTSLEDIAQRADVAVGGIYQHFASKRQLLLVLMDEFLEVLSRLDIRPRESADPRGALHAMLTRAFAADRKYLGACRAWREAAYADPTLARLDREIRAWTTRRVGSVFDWLQRQPGARRGVDGRALARTMDVFFWNLLAQGATMRPADLGEWIESATHLIYHALFKDG